MKDRNVPAKKKTTQTPAFEKDLEALEKIVEELEEGGLSLDDSLKRFEEGMRLAQRCDKALNAAEKKIEVLTRNAEGELEAEPFDEDEEAEESSPPKRRRKPQADADDADDSDDGELLF
jgi:exodeoxyribonuclease VII small subunit